MNSDDQLNPGELFARRFAVDSVLGEGAYGVVYRATDTITDTDTALKVLRPERLAAFTARWREAAMLRRVDPPGVARLIAEGVEDSQPYLAMEFVEGRSFPRPSEPLPWEMIEGYVISLLRTLALVHSAGLVHGDVKPSNVIINDFGQVKLVDFGLSLSAMANDLESTKLHGTPLYMAPELFGGESFTPRTDLFAVGAMVFEAMTGGPFFDTEEVVQWVRLLRTKGPPRISDVIDDPHPVAVKLANALLATDPAKRPASAWEALRLAEGTEESTSAAWLGDTDVVDAALQKLATSGVIVGGPDGSGKSALVDRVVDRLRGQSRIVHTLRAADRPFESLMRSKTIDERLPHVDSEAEMKRLAEAIVRERLTRGEVFAVSNHTSTPDRWTLELLLDLANQTGGIIVATGDEDAANFTVDRFDRGSLAELFEGPELAFHLPSRAAEIVWRRTGGRRGLVFAELEGWKRFHLAQVENDGLIKVSDRSLTLLEQGLQTRSPVTSRSLTDRAYELVCWLSLLGGEGDVAALSAVMSGSENEVQKLLRSLVAAGVVRVDGERHCLMRNPGYFDSVGDRSRAEAISLVVELGLIGAEQRFNLALLGDDPEVVHDAAVHAADEVFEAGGWHDALAILREAAFFVRQAKSDSVDFDRLIHRWGRLAVMRFGGYQIEEILWTLGDDEHPLRQYFEAMRLANVSPGPRALKLLRSVPDTGDVELDRLLRAAMMSCIHRSGGDTRAHFEAVREWGRRVDDPDVDAMCLMWEARLLKIEEDFARAAELARRAARKRTSLMGQLNALFFQASAHFENYELDKAREVAEAVRREAERVGDRNTEMYQAILMLEIELRAGSNPAPDLELVEVVRTIGFQAAEAMARGQVAAAYERRGEIEQAIEILTPAALRARPVAGNSIGLMIVTQLAYLQGRRIPDDVIEASRNTNHTRHLATVLCAAALREPEGVARKLMEEAFELLADYEWNSFLYFVDPSEVAGRLGFDDLVH